MANDLSEVQELRLFNLKLLHGTASEHIAPTSHALLEKLTAGGVEISNATLSNIYLRNKAIMGPFSHRIEAAMGVSKGWLSADHRAWLRSSAEDLALVRQVLSFSNEAKAHLAQFLKHANAGA